MARTQNDYTEHQKNLLPPGLAWARRVGFNLVKLLTARAAGYKEIDDRGFDLIEEADPQTTIELLADWERVTGLPDACLSLVDPGTIAERRANVAAKLTAVGNLTKQQIIDVALKAGYTIEVNEFYDFLVEINGIDDSLSNGQDWRYTFEVYGDVEVNYMHVETGGIDDALAEYDNIPLMCVVTRHKPAFTNDIYRPNIFPKHQENFISAWKLEEASGTLADSVGSNDGTASGGVTYGVTGMDGDALDFDGIDAVVDCGSDSSLQFQDDFTISLWCKPASLGSDQLLAGRVGINYNLIALKINTSNQFEAVIRDDDVAAKATIAEGTAAINTWYHVVLVRRAPYFDLFVNGVWAATAVSLNTPPASGSFRIGGNGRNAGAPSDWFDGIIDEVYVWGAALRPASVAALYNWGPGHFYTS